MANSKKEGKMNWTRMKALDLEEEGQLLALQREWLEQNCSDEVRHLIKAVVELNIPDHDVREALKLALRYGFMGSPLNLFDEVRNNGYSEFLTRRDDPRLENASRYYQDAIKKLHEAGLPEEIREWREQDHPAMEEVLGAKFMPISDFVDRIRPAFEEKRRKLLERGRE